MKIRREEAELFHADGRTDGRTERQTDITKLKVAFCSFPTASKHRTASDVSLSELHILCRSLFETQCTSVT